MRNLVGVRLDGMLGDVAVPSFSCKLRCVLLKRQKGEFCGYLTTKTVNLAHPGPSTHHDANAQQPRVAR